MELAGACQCRMLPPTHSHRPVLLSPGHQRQRTSRCASVVSSACRGPSATALSCRQPSQPGFCGIRTPQTSTVRRAARRHREGRMHAQSQSRPAGASKGTSPSDDASLRARWRLLAKVFWRSGLRQLSSLPLALFEFGIIAALSAVGTVIDQNQSLQWYADHYPDLPGKAFGILDYKLIWALQWDHIYTADYFLAFMAMLAASLAACSATRQWPMVKVARRWRFARSPDSVYSLGLPANAAILPEAHALDFGRVLSQKGYQVFMERGSLYAFKGLAGKLGPIGVHASMLAIMAGVAVGGLGGWKGTIQIPEGGDIAFRDIIRPYTPLALAPQGADAVLHVNSFDVKYRPDGSEEQFVSDLSVWDSKGQELKRKNIQVNTPLRYKGITAYQTDYNMVALTVRAPGSPLQPMGDSAFNVPMAALEGEEGVKGKLWVTFIPSTQQGEEGAPPRGVSILARDFQVVTLYKADGAFAGVRRIGSGTPIEVEGMQITVDSAIGSTGLEVKADPGVPYVYAGFGGMMITTLISYLSHSQVWALEKDGRLHVGGKSNKATVSFASEFGAMLESVPQRAGPGGAGALPPAQP